MFVSGPTIRSKLAKNADRATRYRGPMWASRLGWLPLLCVLGCDHGERIDGLERVTETLQEGLIAAAQENEGLRADLGAAQARVEAADADREALEKRVESLEGALVRVEETLHQAPPVEPPAPPPEVPGGVDERYRVPVGGSASKGPDDAKVTVVMITDFQCPFCKRVQAALRSLEHARGDELRIVVKHNPLVFHPRARAAALAAEAARLQDKFWEMHDLLYEHSRALSDADLRGLAEQAGCDVRRFERDLRRADIARQVDEDIALARRVGARGTPSFFINGRYLAGAQPVSAFEAIIDQEMVEADRRIAAGTATSNLYDELMRDAKSAM